MPVSLPISGVDTDTHVKMRMMRIHFIIKMSRNLSSDESRLTLSNELCAHMKAQHAECYPHEDQEEYSYCVDEFNEKLRMHLINQSSELLIASDLVDLHKSSGTWYTAPHYHMIPVEITHEKGVGVDRKKKLAENATIFLAEFEFEYSKEWRHKVLDMWLADVTEFVGGMSQSISPVAYSMANLELKLFKNFVKFELFQTPRGDERVDVLVENLESLFGSIGHITKTMKTF